MASSERIFRKPYGPGWALVGDAGYTKDPITAQGMRDAFDDAEMCASALDRVFAQGRPFEEAMAECQRARDERALPMYELTCQAATLQPPPPEMQQLLGAIQGNQKAMDAFVRVNAGTTPPAESGHRAFALNKLSLAVHHLAGRGPGSWARNALLRSVLGGDTKPALA